MDVTDPVQSQGFSNSPVGPFRALLVNSIRFWEFRRVFYNLILAAVVLVWLIATWPHFRPALTPHSLLLLTILALIANACYCAAYLADIPMLSSPLSTIWIRRRWILWLFGTLFAILLANYWIVDEIYPFVQ